MKQTEWRSYQAGVRTMYEYVAIVHRQSLCECGNYCRDDIVRIVPGTYVRYHRYSYSEGRRHLIPFRLLSLHTTGEANPGGGKDRVELFIERAKKNVIVARDSLKTVISILDLKV